MNLDNMVDGVLEQAEGCPFDRAKRAMRQACIQFCEKTYALVQGFELATSEIDPGQIDMSALVVIDLIDARINGETIQVLASNEEGVQNATTEKPVVVKSNDPSVAFLLPAPTSPVTIELLVALKPGPDATEVPDLLWQQYHETLEKGALARVFDDSKKPWTDKADSMVKRADFESACDRIGFQLGRNRVQNAQLLRVTPLC